MTEETTATTAQIDFTLEAEWRTHLPEVFRPIAERYGQRLFQVAWAIGSINEALGRAMPKVEHHHELKNCLVFIAQSTNILSHFAMEATKLDPLKLSEIQRDMERAAQLDMASRNTAGGRIIVPS